MKRPVWALNVDACCNLDSYTIALFEAHEAAKEAFDALAPYHEPGPGRGLTLIETSVRPFGFTTNGPFYCLYDKGTTVRVFESEADAIASFDGNGWDLSLAVIPELNIIYEDPLFDREVGELTIYTPRAGDSE